MRGPFGDFGNKVFIVVGVVLLTIGWIFTFIRIQQTKEVRKQLRNIKDFRKVIINGNTKINNQKGKKLLNELGKEKIPPHHSSPVEPRIFIKVILENGEVKVYSIAPDSDVRGEFWVYLENAAEHYSESPINRVHSDWILNFLKEKGLYNYSFEEE